MNVCELISNLNGTFKGYGRLAVRHRVAQNASLRRDEIAALSRRCFDARVRTALMSPWYCDFLRRRGMSMPPPAGPVQPGDLPVVTKSDIAEYMVSCPHRASSGVFAHATGGSTGVPCRFYVTRESYEWRTAVSNRGYAWASAEEGRRSFYVWGTSVTPPTLVQRWKSSMHHRLQNREYFDSFLFDDAAKAECCRLINTFRPVSLVGYTGSLVDLAQFVAQNTGSLSWRARTGVTAAEGLRPGMRDLIQKYLVDELFMSYGSREFMLIGMECREHCGYHISSDNLYVEVVDDDGRACAPGDVGRIVVTDLHNSATPFIRYEIGDLGAMASEPCACGLPFPVLAAVEGRLQEVIVRADGERLTALFIPHLMKEFAWVDGYQVVQDRPGRMVMNLVTTDEGWEGKTGKMMEHLREKLGPSMEIFFAKVDRLHKTTSGKTPIVRCDTVLPARDGTGTARDE